MIGILRTVTKIPLIMMSSRLCPPHDNRGRCHYTHRCQTGKLENGELNPFKRSCRRGWGVCISGLSSFPNQTTPSLPYFSLDIWALGISFKALFKRKEGNLCIEYGVIILLKIQLDQWMVNFTDSIKLIM